MDYDQDKVDDAVLALLFLTMSSDKYGTRAGRGYDQSIMDRLCAKGYISDLTNKLATLAVTAEGKARAEQLFRQMFGK